MFHYVFTCDLCKAETKKCKDFTIAEPNCFCMDDGWEDFPLGWRHGPGQLLCPRCAEKQQDKK